jgi:SAM-dependent methyltransferase
VLADRSESGPARGVAWRPSPWLVHCLPHLPPGARTLDVACGSGRNVAALAAAGARATGLDLLPDALERAQQLVAGLPVAPALVVADATRPLPFRPRSFQIVTGFRYLDRALFPRLAALLVPGGELWWETFNAAQARLGHPRRPEFLLAPGELPRLCAAAGLEVLEAQELDAAPALSAVRARRAPAGGSASSPTKQRGLVQSGDGF